MGSDTNKIITLVSVSQFAAPPGGAVTSFALRDKGAFEAEQRDVSAAKRGRSALMFASAVFAMALVASGLAHEAHAQVPAAPVVVPVEAPKIDAAATQASGDTKGPDGGGRVKRSINFGFTRDLGAAPAMDHRIRDSGISLPQCFGESRDGQVCK